MKVEIGWQQVAIALLGPGRSYEATAASWSVRPTRFAARESARLRRAMIPVRAEALSLCGLRVPERREWALKPCGAKD